MHTVPAHPAQAMSQWGVHLVGLGNWPSRHARGRTQQQSQEAQSQALRSRSPRGERREDRGLQDRGRQDAPVRRQGACAGLPASLADEGERARALEDFRLDMFAPSNRHVMEYKLKTVKKALEFWNLEVVPPSVDKIHCLGAALKAGGYKSAPTYLSAYRGLVERSGFTLTAAENRAFQDASRSCLRGVGGPVRAMALPFSRLHELPADRGPWAAGGPVSPRNLVVAGSWFLMREIEASLALASSVTLETSSATPSVAWALPVSKTDPQALGVSRRHGCSCRSPSSPTPSCPTHALWDQLLFLRRRFPERFKMKGDQSVPDATLPLFPNERGEVCDKEAVVNTIIEAGRKLGMVVANSDGTERLSGHSLRVTGAQGLTRLGVDLWAVQLMGRWGSDKVKTYVREVQLERASEWATSAAKKEDLESLVDKVLAALPAGVIKQVEAGTSCTSSAASTSLTETIASLAPAVSAPSSSSCCPTAAPSSSSSSTSSNFTSFANHLVKITTPLFTSLSPFASGPIYNPICL